MYKKGVIIGNFVNKNNILRYLEELKTKYNIDYEKIYVYSINSNDKEYLVTFKTYDKDKYITKIFGAKIMHVKNGCIFSINALNKLIELNYDFEKEKPYNEIEINWDEYKDSLIVVTNGDLKVSKLTKIEDKCDFFNLK